MKPSPRFLLALLVNLFFLPAPSGFAQRDEFYSGGALARVRVVNQFRSPVNVYQLDRWNGWDWIGSVDGGSEASFRARPRQMLLVTSARGDVLSQTPVSLEGTSVVVGDNGGYDRREDRGLTSRDVVRDLGRHFGGFEEQGRARLHFKNKTDSKVDLFRVDRSGQMEKVGDLGGGKEVDVKAEVGSEWLVLNKKGRKLARVIVRGDEKISIND